MLRLVLIYMCVFYSNLLLYRYTINVTARLVLLLKRFYFVYFILAIYTFG